jgi:hypothetical protein
MNDVTAPHNVMTIGYRETAIASHAAAAWGMLALRALQRVADCGGPDMIVGEPGGQAERLEDDGRTRIIPLPADIPRLYACMNETGGCTLMLAEEY